MSINPESQNCVEYAQGEPCPNAARCGGTLKFFNDFGHRGLKCSSFMVCSWARYDDDTDED